MRLNAKTHSLEASPILRGYERGLIRESFRSSVIHTAAVSPVAHVARANLGHSTPFLHTKVTQKLQMAVDQDM